MKKKQFTDPNPNPIATELGYVIDQLLEFVNTLKLTRDEKYIFQLHKQRLLNVKEAIKKQERGRK